MNSERITRETMVSEALERVPGAVFLFMRHGVNPMDKCSAEYDWLTIAAAEDRCGLIDIDALVDELNAACSSS